MQSISRRRNTTAEIIDKVRAGPGRIMKQTILTNAEQIISGGNR